MTDSILAVSSKQMQTLLESASLKQDVFVARFLSIVIGIADKNKSTLATEFDEVYEYLSKLTGARDTPLHQWYLCHPSFPVFWAFVQDKELLTHFANLLWFARPHHTGGKRALKRRLRANLDPLRDFAKRYTELIRDHHPTSIDYVTGMAMFGRSRIRCIELTSLSQFSAQDHAECAQKKLEQINESLFAEFAHKTQEGMRIHGQDLYNLYQEFAGKKMLNIILDENDWQFLLNRDHGEVVFSYSPRRYSALSTSESLEQKIYSSLYIGLWPRFKAGAIDQVLLQADYPHMDTEIHELLAKALNNKYKMFMQFVTTHRKCHHQLLSIGLKLHHLKRLPNDFRHTSGFSLSDSVGALVLPPVGNIAAAKELIRQLDAHLGITIVGNPQMFQIQVCTPGRLSDQHCGILGSAFYLGSDVIRNFSSKNLTTSHDSLTGKRLVIYDAGILDSDFDWNPNLPRTAPKFLQTKPEGRTDVLCCESWQDIENVNLVASLLVHLEHQGTLTPVATEFVDEFNGILKQYGLGYTQQVPWVAPRYQNNRQQTVASKEFDKAFASMQTLALADAREQVGQQRQKGLLYDVQQLLWYTRTLVEGGY